MFIGFGLEDAYLTEVLQRVGDMLWEWQTTTHFAVVPLDAAKAGDQLRRAEELRRKMGIETVFFPIVDGRFDALETLLLRIGRAVRARRLGPPAPVAELSAVDGAPPAMPEWVKRNNEELLERSENEN